MPSRYPIGGWVSALVAMGLEGCVVVHYPPPEALTLGPPDAEQAPRRIAVLAPDAEVRRLSLLGVHDKHPEHSAKAVDTWRLAIIELGTQKPSYKPADVTRWDDATTRDWLEARAHLERWLAALFEERLGTYERTLGGADKKEGSPAATLVRHELNAGGIALEADFPTLDSPTAEGIALQLDWERWRREFDADELLILYSTDTRVTADRLTVAIVGGAVGGAVTGAVVALGCMPGGGGNDPLSAGLGGAVVLACAVVTVPIGAVNGMVVIPQRFSGEHRFAAARVDMHTGRLVFVARSLVDNDSDDVAEDTRLLLQLAP